MSRVNLDPQIEAQLRATFNIAGGEQAAPTELSDTIQPVYAIFAAAGGSLGITGLQEEVDAGAAGVRVAASSAVPSGFYRWVHAIFCFHNEAVNHTLSLVLSKSAALGGGGAVMSNATVSNTQGLGAAVTRNIIVPAGYFLRAEIDALGVGNVLTLVFEFLQLPLGVAPPVV